MTRKLRAVTPDEKAPRREVTTVSAAVVDGDRREQLEAMRKRIAKAIDSDEIRGADLASLSRRLMEIGKELEVLAAAEKQEAADDARDVSPESFDSSAI